jgi:phosphatidylethanolamine/phosphatidyl-N-methylethanolamine N-methyltransferase
MPQAVPNSNPVIAPKKLSGIRKRRHFFIAALRSPFKIGSLVPSSRGLAKAMAGAVDVSRVGAVIELGAGTGVVTQALVKAGIAPNDLVVIERDEGLHHVMSSQFPHLNVLKADAMHLDAVLAEHGITKVNAIVSSLPFLSMPKEVREAIWHHMATLIGEDGLIVQFTYGPKSPISVPTLRKYKLHGRRIKLVVANVPPAHVWVYRFERRAKVRV